MCHYFLQKRDRLAQAVAGSLAGLSGAVLASSRYLPAYLRSRPAGFKRRGGTCRNGTGYW